MGKTTFSKLVAESYRSVKKQAQNADPNFIFEYLRLKNKENQSKQTTITGRVRKAARLLNRREKKTIPLDHLSVTLPAGCSTFKLPEEIKIVNKISIYKTDGTAVTVTRNGIGIYTEERDEEEKMDVDID